MNGSCKLFHFNFKPAEIPDEFNSLNYKYQKNENGVNR